MIRDRGLGNRVPPITITAPLMPPSIRPQTLVITTIYFTVIGVTVITTWRAGRRRHSARAVTRSREPAVRRRSVPTRRPATPLPVPQQLPGSADPAATADPRPLRRPPARC